MRYVDIEKEKTERRNKSKLIELDAFPNRIDSIADRVESREREFYYWRGYN